MVMLANLLYISVTPSLLISVSMRLDGLVVCGWRTGRVQCQNNVVIRNVDGGRVTRESSGYYYWYDTLR